MVSRVQRSRRAWARVIATGDTKLLELFLALMSCALGVHFLLPGSTVTTGGEVYRIMAHIAPDGVWGMLLLFVGLWGGWRLVCDSSVLLVPLLLVGLVTWWFMALSTAISNVHGLAGPIFTVIAIGYSFVYVAHPRKHGRV